MDRAPSLPSDLGEASPAGERWELACRTTGGHKTQFAQRHWKNKVQQTAGKGRDLYALSWTPKEGERKYVFHVCVPSNTEPTLDELVSICKERYLPWVGQKQRRAQSLPAPTLHHSQSTSTLTNLTSPFTVHENPCADHGPLLHARSMGARAFDSRTPKGADPVRPRLMTAHSSPFPEHLDIDQDDEADTSAGPATAVALVSPSPIATPAPTASRRSFIGREYANSSRNSSYGGASDSSAAQTPARASPSAFGPKAVARPSPTVAKPTTLSRPSPMSQVGEETQSCWGSLTRSATEMEGVASPRGAVAGGDGGRAAGSVAQRLKAALGRLSLGCFSGSAAA